MLARGGITLFAAFLMTCALFLVMASLIRSDQVQIDDEVYDIPVIDFVRLPDEEPLITGSTPKPELVEPPPPAPRIKPLITSAPGGDISMRYTPPVKPIKAIAMGQTSVIPLMIVQPDYPQRQRAKGTQGYVTIGFTVSRFGTVVDPYVIESQPQGAFDRSVLQAIKKSKFKPQMVSGQAIDSSGFQYRYVFEIKS